MGYDPYDFYDLGNINQKGETKTWFGSKEELLGLIATAHARGMDVYADLVINHNSGGDVQEVNPIDQKQQWTKFTPRSGKFKRDYTHFHSSPGVAKMTLVYRVNKIRKATAGVNFMPRREVNKVMVSTAKKEKL